jgi:hypothetical protein
MFSSSAGIRGHTSITCTGLWAVAQAVNKGSMITIDAANLIAMTPSDLIHLGLQGFLPLPGLLHLLGLRFLNRIPFRYPQSLHFPHPRLPAFAVGVPSSPGK